MSRTRRRLLLAAAALAAGAGAVAIFRPRPLEVEVAVADLGPLRVVVEGTGRTRVAERYVVLTPVPGALVRLDVHEGDTVRAGDAVGAIVPAAPAPLDARTRRELTARLAAARAAEAEARSALQRARVAAAEAAREGARTVELAEAGAVAAREADLARDAARVRAEEVRMAEAARARAAGEVQAARAALAGAEGAARGERVLLRAPASGRVLRVERESEGPVAAGAPVLEVGDPASLEVDLELLTADAVRIRPGAAVEVVRWGGEGSLAGVVRRIDPAAYTKVSALGVEEQRVHVVVAPVGGAGWSRLGDAFAVDARVVVEELPDALRVPPGALFRDGPRWAVFAVAAGRAQLRAVQVRAEAEDAVAVSAGVTAGERVVLHPSDQLRDGAAVRATERGRARPRGHAQRSPHRNAVAATVTRTAPPRSRSAPALDRAPVERGARRPTRARGA